MATCTPCLGLVQGCRSLRKNVCREHVLSTGEGILLDRLLYPIYKWVDTLPKDVLEQHMGFFMLRDEVWHDDVMKHPVGPHVPCYSAYTCVMDAFSQPKVQYLLPHTLGKT